MAAAAVCHGTWGLDRHLRHPQSTRQSSQDDTNRTVPIYQPTCDAYHQCMRFVVG